MSIYGLNGVQTNKVYDISGREIISGDIVYDMNQTGFVVDPEYITVNNDLYRLVWRDEFTGSDIDRNFWTDYYCISNVTGRYLARGDYWLENSMLNLRIKKGALGRHSADDASNTQAMCGIQTSDVNGQCGNTALKFKHDVNPFWGLITQEGYYECRFKMFNRNKYGGRHFAWWSEGIADYKHGQQLAEIDYCELGLTGYTTSIPHGTHAAPTEFYKVTGVNVDFQSDFQTLAVLWEDGILNWYLNGELVDTNENITTPQYPMMHYLTMYEGTAAKASGDLVTQVDYLRIYKKATSRSSEAVTIVGQREITIDGKTADLTIDTDRGCPIAFPQYCYLNWSDGTRTEHWVQWDQPTSEWQSNISDQTSFVWTGKAHNVGIQVTATITF